MDVQEVKKLNDAPDPLQEREQRLDELLKPAIVERAHSLQKTDDRTELRFEPLLRLLHTLENSIPDFLEEVVPERAKQPCYFLQESPRVLEDFENHVPEERTELHKHGPQPLQHLQDISPQVLNQPDHIIDRIHCAPLLPVRCQLAKLRNLRVAITLDSIRRSGRCIVVAHKGTMRTNPERNALALTHATASAEGCGICHD